MHDMNCSAALPIYLSLVRSEGLGCVAPRGAMGEGSFCCESMVHTWLYTPTTALLVSRSPGGKGAQLLHAKGLATGAFSSAFNRPLLHASMMFTCMGAPIISAGIEPGGICISMCISNLSQSSHAHSVSQPDNSKDVFPLDLDSSCRWRVGEPVQMTQ